jgi:hypothetical protein
VVTNETGRKRTERSGRQPVNGSLDHGIGVRIPASQPNNPFKKQRLAALLIELPSFGLRTTLSEAASSTRKRFAFSVLRGARKTFGVSHETRMRRSDHPMQTVRPERMEGTSTHDPEVLCARSSRGRWRTEQATALLSEVVTVKS